MATDSQTNNALRQYTKKKISYFESIIKEEKILKERINILENYFRQNFNYEKSREYIRDIFTFELIAVSAISRTEIIDGDIKAACRAINNINDFYSKNPDLLKDFLLLLAKYAISDLYYFLNTYWFQKHKTQMNFKVNYPSAATELKTIIETHRPTNEFMKLFFSQKEFTSKFFIKTNDKTGYTIDEVIFKDFYDKNLTNDSHVFFSSSALSKLIEKMSQIHIDMENHFKLLYHYYDNKTGKPFRYNFILENFEEKKNTGVISVKLFNEFRDYNNSFNIYREIIEQRGLINFGFEDFPYKESIILLYKYCRILEFVYLRKGYYDKLNNLRNTILNSLEKRLIAVNLSA